MWTDKTGLLNCLVSDEGNAVMEWDDSHHRMTVLLKRSINFLLTINVYMGCFCGMKNTAILTCMPSGAQILVYVIHGQWLVVLC